MANRGTRLHLLAVLFAGVALAWPGGARAQENFTAVWRAGNDANFVWVADWNSFSAKWAELSKQNLRLVDLDTTVVGGKRQWMGAWRAGSDGHYLFVGLSWSAFEARWAELSKQNFRLTRMKTYLEGGQRKWAGVWRAGSDGHYLFVGLDWKGFEAKWAQLAKQNFRLTDMETYVEGGERKFAGVWREGSDGYALLVGLDWKTFGAKWEALSKQNLRLVDLKSYVDGGVKRYAGVWRAGADGHYLFAGLDPNGFKKKFADLDKQNFRVTRLLSDNACATAGAACCNDNRCVNGLVCGQAETCEHKKPMDIVWNAVDGNGLPLDPRWAVQSFEPHAQARPDPINLCKLHGGAQNAKICTDTHVVLDFAKAAEAANTAMAILGIIFTGGISTAVQAGTNSWLCPGLLHGHLKWFPVTMQGMVWNHGGPMTGGTPSTRTTYDSDYNFDFIPNDTLEQGIKPLFTATQGSDKHPGRGIHMEVNAYEGFGDFKTPWWASYRSQVDNHGAGEADIAMINQRQSIATGWVSLDCAHECHIELHPLFALAVQDTVAATSEHWSFFAGNHGGGGYCASNDYELDLPQEGKGRFIYKFNVPWKDGATSFKLHSGSIFHKHVVADWVGHNTGGHGTDEVAAHPGDVTVHGSPEQGLVIKIALPAPAQRAVIEGAVGIDWVMAKDAPHSAPPHHAPPPSANAAPHRPRIDHAEFHQELVGKLTAAQRAKLPAFRRETKVTSSKPAAITQVAAPAAAPAAARTGVRAVPDRDHAKRLAAHWEAIRKAFGSDAAFKNAAHAVAGKLGIPVKK